MTVDPIFLIQLIAQFSVLLLSTSCFLLPFDGTPFGRGNTMTIGNGISRLLLIIGASKAACPVDSDSRNETRPSAHIGWAAECAWQNEKTFAGRTSTGGTYGTVNSITNTQRSTPCRDPDFSKASTAHSSTISSVGNECGRRQPRLTTLSTNYTYYCH